MGGSSSFKCLESVMTSDTKAQAVHGKVDTAAVASGLGPGDPLASNFEDGPSALITRSV